MKTVRISLIFACLVSAFAALPVQAADVADWIVYREMEQDREQATAPKKPKVVDYNHVPKAAPQKPKQVVVVENSKAVVPAKKQEVQEDRSPFASPRNFIYKYGSITASAAQDALFASMMRGDEEINPEEVAREAVRPALLTLPVDIICEGGKKASQSLVGEDLVSPLGDTIGKVTTSAIVSHYDSAVDPMTKREIGESLATDILYALPKFTLACALKEGLGWGLGYPFNRTLDTWTGTFHCFIGDMIEGAAKRIIKYCLQKFVVEAAANDLLGRETPAYAYDTEDQDQEITA